MTDVERLESWLRQEYQAFASAKRLPSLDLVLPHPIHQDEAAGFLRAQDRRLIRPVGGPGQFELVGVQQAGTSKSRYSLFSGGKAAGLNRQYLMQVTALGELYFDLRWRGDRLVFERDGFDVFALDAQGNVVIGGVVDKDAAVLRSRVDRVIDALGSGDTGTPKLTQQVIDGVRLRRPATLWGVGPGVRLVFDLVYEDDRVRVSARAQLPGRDR